MTHVQGAVDVPLTRSSEATKYIMSNAGTIVHPTTSHHTNARPTTPIAMARA